MHPCSASRGITTHSSGCTIHCPLTYRLWLSLRLHCRMRARFFPPLWPPRRHLAMWLRKAPLPLSNTKQPHCFESATRVDGLQRCTAFYCALTAGTPLRVVLFPPSVFLDTQRAARSTLFMTEATSLRLLRRSWPSPSPSTFVAFALLSLLPLSGVSRAMCLSPPVSPMGRTC